MVGIAVLLADKVFDPEELLVPAGLLAGAFLASAIVIWSVDNWRKNRARREESVDSLSSFRAMFEKGELTRAEYDVIRARLAEKILSPGGGVTGRSSAARAEVPQHDRPPPHNQERLPNPPASDIPPNPPQPPLPP